MPVIFELIAYSLVFAALAAIAVWKCAENSFLWMFVPENWVILLDRGKGHPFKVLGIGKTRVDALLTRLGLDYGIYWMGFPPVEVHKFLFKHERVNTKLGPETNSDEWIVDDGVAVETDHLLNKVIHWVKVPGVEFMGGQRADLLFKYEATIAGEDGACTAVRIREGKFYEALNSIINSSVISTDVIRKKDYKEFMSEDKHEGTKLCVDIEKAVNQTAGTTSGYTLVPGSLAVIRFDASSTAETKLARLKMEARIQAAAAKLRAKGEVADVTEMIKIIMKELPDADHTTVIQEVSKLGVAKRFADSKHLQAVGGAMLGISSDENSGGNKQRRKK